MIVKNAKLEDAKSLALLHKQVFGKIHFTTSFSVLLLSEYFENLIKKMKYRIVIEEDASIVGYLFAGINSGQIINRFLKENFTRVLFYLLLNPRFIVEKITELISKIIHKNNKTQSEVSLYLIAADTRLGRRGIGKELVKYFEDMLISNHEQSYTLSVRKNNQQAIDFYIKNNFIQIESNNKSIKFRKVFDS